MNRKKVMAGVKDFIPETDIIFCVGASLVSESCFSKGENIFYHYNDRSDVLSIAIGLAMSTKKRVIVIMEDHYMLRYLNSIAQASVSKCRNLFFFVILTNVYSNSTTQSTITESFRNISGTMFNLGFFAYNYSSYLKNKADVRKLKNIFSTARGPFVSFIAVDDQKLYSSDIKTNDIDGFKEHIATVLPEIEEKNIEYLNLDAIIKV